MLILDTPSIEKMKNETPDSKEASASSESIVVSTDHSTNLQTPLSHCLITLILFFQIDSGRLFE